MTISSFLLQLVRLLVCSMFAVLMFVGVVQIGLRWESTQQSYPAGLALDESSARPYLGRLSQNWSGDFTFSDAKGEVVATFTPDRIVSLTVTSRLPAADPWRLILSLFVAAMAGVATAYGGIVATRSWAVRAPPMKRHARPSQPPVRPGSRVSG